MISIEKSLAEELPQTVDSAEAVNPVEPAEHHKHTSKCKESCPVPYPVPMPYPVPTPTPSPPSFMPFNPYPSPSPYYYGSGAGFGFGSGYPYTSTEKQSDDPCLWYPLFPVDCKKSTSDTPKFDFNFLKPVNLLDGLEIDAGRNRDRDRDKDKGIAPMIFNPETLIPDVPIATPSPSPSSIYDSLRRKTSVVKVIAQNIKKTPNVSAEVIQEFNRVLDELIENLTKQKSVLENISEIKIGFEQGSEIEIDAANNGNKVKIGKPQITIPGDHKTVKAAFKLLEKLNNEFNKFMKKLYDLIDDLLSGSDMWNKMFR